MFTSQYVRVRRLWEQFNLCLDHCTHQTDSCDIVADASVPAIAAGETFGCSCLRAHRRERNSYHQHHREYKGRRHGWSVRTRVTPTVSTPNMATVSQQLRTIPVSDTLCQAMVFLSFFSFGQDSKNFLIPENFQCCAHGPQ